MRALLQRNIRIYFANIPGVIMSCLGALISFFIYIGFLQRNLERSWSNVPHITEMLDLWMIAGIVSIAGITTSFQALGQLVKDRETRTVDDLSLTDTSLSARIFAYILSSVFVSLVMQIITFAIMSIYFTVVDKINIPNNAYLLSSGFLILGAISATLLNGVITFFIHSYTTFSRLSSVLGAAAGFAVATYMPYGILTSHAQTLVKLIPSSYEAAALRSILLDKVNKALLTGKARTQMFNYLGVNFKINGYRLTRMDDACVMLGMTVLLIAVLIALSLITGKRQSNVRKVKNTRLSAGKREPIEE